MEVEKTPKQRYKEETAPYRAWLNSISIPIGLIVLFLAVFFGFTINAAGMIIFAFAIITHVNYKRIHAPKICHVAPILYYVYNVLSIFYLISIIANPQGSPLAVVLSLLNFILLILVIVFYFIGANAIKKQFPTMKEDYERAVAIYKSKK
ncbi:hypothetical protein [Lactococcus garvieae]|jgi:hypothetical protein|uniref:Uncharacterized protein n=1 Tax=Lactococcus garvieae DCC43 TaxID=1231377 RepID=K2PJM5_9LACT|nr:hypothetical protein [Lactococcus garvieae]EKF51575.1 hypothetical protein C426_1162 [Lactococcus garvieae DCC43]